MSRLVEYYRERLKGPPEQSKYPGWELVRTRFGECYRQDGEGTSRIIPRELFERVMQERRR